MAKMFIAPERKFERGQGCWNCKSYENGDLSRQNWADRKTKHLLVLSQSAPLVRLSEQEKPVPSAHDARLDQIRAMTKAVQVGVVGMCMKGARPLSLGGPEGDFVEHRFLCDRWTGRDGASVARQGKTDLLPGELDERALERVKK